jgi:hypothetical protein
MLDFPQFWTGLCNSRRACGLVFGQNCLSRCPGTDSTVHCIKTRGVALHMSFFDFGDFGPVYPRLGVSVS